MRKSIENTFPQVHAQQCLVTNSDLKFHVYDSVTLPRRCYIRLEETDEVHFIVNNPTGMELCFLAIDSCLFNETGIRRCDFAVFNNSIFAFVEIKDIKAGQRRNARKQAQIQLASTMRHFIAKGIKFNGKLEAIVCFVTEKIYPAITAQAIDAVVEFEEEFGANFLIGNSRIF